MAITYVGGTIGVSQNDALSTNVSTLAYTIPAAGLAANDLLVAVMTIDNGTTAFPTYIFDSTTGTGGSSNTYNQVKHLNGSGGTAGTNTFVWYANAFQAMAAGTTLTLDVKGNGIAGHSFLFHIALLHFSGLSQGWQVDVNSVGGTESVLSASPTTLTNSVTTTAAGVEILLVWDNYFGQYSPAPSYVAGSGVSNFQGSAGAGGSPQTVGDLLTGTRINTVATSANMAVSASGNTAGAESIVLGIVSFKAAPQNLTSAVSMTLPSIATSLIKGFFKSINVSVPISDNLTRLPLALLRTATTSINTLLNVFISGRQFIGGRLPTESLPTLIDTVLRQNLVLARPVTESINNLTTAIQKQWGKSFAEVMPVIGDSVATVYNHTFQALTRAINENVSGIADSIQKLRIVSFTENMPTSASALGSQVLFRAPDIESTSTVDLQPAERQVLVRGLVPEALNTLFSVVESAQHTIPLSAGDVLPEMIDTTLNFLGNVTENVPFISDVGTLARSRLWQIIVSDWLPPTIGSVLTQTIYNRFVTQKVVLLPSAINGPSNGTNPPSPLISINSEDTNGVFSFGTGITPSSGVQVKIRFYTNRASVPNIKLTALNAAAQALTLSALNITSDGFDLSVAQILPSNQPNNTYLVQWQIV